LWAEWGERLQYVPVVTRQAEAGMLQQRIPALLASGALAEAPACR
jgi:ferredoxin--NADP+ reductase